MGAMAAFIIIGRNCGIKLIIINYDIIIADVCLPLADLEHGRNGGSARAAELNRLDQLGQELLAQIHVRQRVERL